MPVRRLFWPGRFPTGAFPAARCPGELPSSTSLSQNIINQVTPCHTDQETVIDLNLLLVAFYILRSLKGVLELCLKGKHYPDTDTPLPPKNSNFIKSNPCQSSYMAIGLALKDCCGKRSFQAKSQKCKAVLQEGRFLFAGLWVF